MDDSEKLIALKKAYAEIILNTAKEAASRIVVSERKAFRYQQELFAAKEEGLRMLLRLKQMLDSKVHEAEMTALSQQRRIEELEAQLGEAEDIVKDLRVELGDLQDALERMTNQMQLLDEQNSRGETAAPVETLEVDKLNTSQIIYPEAQSELVLNGTYDVKQCLHNDNCYACNSDFASIVMRRKEPELYRNGCTQRIRALERSLMNGNVSLSGKEDDIRNELSVNEDEGEDTCVELSVKADICRVDEKTDKAEGMQVDDNCTQADVRGPRRKRKRATRFRKFRPPSSISVPNQIVETCQTSLFFDKRPFPYPPSYIAEVGEDSQKIENNFQKDPEFTLNLKSVSWTTKIETQAEHEEVSGGDNEEFIKSCTVQKNERLLIDKMDLRQESGCAQNLEVPASNPDLAAVDLSSVNSVVNVSNLTEEPTQPVNNKFLKYTFSRKRKKEFMSSPDSDRLLEETTMKRNTEEEKNNTLEPKSQKSSLISESSGDSWPLAQLARQLISLLENQ